MSNTATTKMSSKGQVVIPEEIRERLKLKPGNQFVVIGDGDAIVLKMITPPSKSEFKSLLAKARKVAKEKGIKQTDIAKAIKSVRSSH